MKIAVRKIYPLRFLFVLLLVGIAGCPQQSNYVKISGLTMGTGYHITFEDNFQRAPEIQLKIDQELLLINQQMSTYINDSELSIFNRSQSTECQALSESTVHVIAEALQVSQQTSGHFDVTIGPLIAEWGFDNKQTHQQIPSDQTIAELVNNIGYKKVKIKNNCVQKTHPTLSINLSAIAKGFAVDHIAKLLTKNDVNNYLVEIGGETASKGFNPSARNWVLAIESPNIEQRQIQQRFSPNGLGVATSGDYRNYFEKDGVRFSHTIDPVSGKPITHNLASVTVLHPQTMLADAYATAFSVMGDELALEFANKNNIPIYLLIKHKTEFKAVYNKAFESHFLPTKDR
ncbi:MAG: FAD:protein FMN transferase [Kangiellaceae bacterium]|nr:FAD:protein FMN transferase [Kangiellaceae bacterium]